MKGLIQMHRCANLFLTGMLAAFGLALRHAKLLGTTHRPIEMLFVTSEMERIINFNILVI